ncbi:ArsR family transcriptional regulator [bacterium]|nr:MAG: ArsR family transcriptional regulator [bacterium]
MNELLDRQFSALADPTRRAIFERLVGEALPVGKLADGLPVSRPAVSQHLKVLEDAGLVSYVSVGTRNIYRADPEGIAAFRRYLDGLWHDALTNLKIHAERTKP